MFHSCGSIFNKNNVSVPLLPTVCAGVLCQQKLIILSICISIKQSEGFCSTSSSSSHHHYKEVILGNIPVG